MTLPIHGDIGRSGPEGLGPTGPKRVPTETCDVICTPTTLINSADRVIGPIPTTRWKPTPSGTGAFWACDGHLVTLHFFHRATARATAFSFILSVCFVAEPQRTNPGRRITTSADGETETPSACKRGMAEPRPVTKTIPDLVTNRPGRF